jgi:mRNA interferase MazF
MKRGDIVLVAFPHANGTASKRRPALIVQADFYNQRISNVLLAAITGNLARARDPAHYLVEVSTAEGSQSGLNKDSLISCLNIAVLPKSAIGPTIGELPAATMLKIDLCLKAALGLA